MGLFGRCWLACLPYWRSTDEGETKLADACMTKCARHLGRVREARNSLAREEAAEFDGLDVEWHVYRLELVRWRVYNMTNFY